MSKKKTVEQLNEEATALRREAQEARQLRRAEWLHEDAREELRVSNLTSKELQDESKDAQDLSNFLDETDRHRR